MRIKIFFFIITICFIWVFSIKAQNIPLYERNYSFSPNLLFRHFAEQDIPGAMLSFSIFQGKNGFLWAATPQGLTRWDGREYYVFKHEEGDSSSLPGNYVVNMLEDAKGNLWVGTDAGFARFNEKSNTFERHGAAKTYSASFTFLMSCDSKNRLYLYEAGQKCDHRIYDIKSQKYVDFSNQLFEQAVFLRGFRSIVN